MFRLLAALLGLVSGSAWVWAQEAEPKAPPAQTTFRVPYQLLDTRHVLVRLKLNGAGPFHFIIDTGAPALFVSTEAGKAAGLIVDDKGWATVETLEIEGGIRLTQARARVEDPFQLVGMNKMNINGLKLHGMLGYTVLAKYRVTFDFTDTHLTWRELAWTPPPPAGLAQLGGKAPPDLSAMTNLSNFATSLIGRRPDPVLQPRGYLGIELTEQQGQVRIEAVHGGAPAAAAGLKVGDVLLSVDGQEVASLSKLHEQSAKWKEGTRLALKVRRGGETFEVEVVAGRGI